ncbi:hypothetical protein TNCV_368511 [Trichonephila clavipes]|nr:hypothetical protein TNCV_368511 [Trichonephila clavipes]
MFVEVVVYWLWLRTRGCSVAGWALVPMKSRHEVDSGERNLSRLNVLPLAWNGSERIWVSSPLELVSSTSCFNITWSVAKSPHVAE